MACPKMCSPRRIGSMISVSPVVLSAASGVWSAQKPELADMSDIVCYKCRQVAMIYPRARVDNVGPVISGLLMNNDVVR